MDAPLWLIVLLMFAIVFGWNIDYPLNEARHGSHESTGGVLLFMAVVGLVVIGGGYWLISSRGG